MELDGILKFVKLIAEFQKIERTVFLMGSDRMENDVEHSYQLTMVAWYAISAYNLPLDLDLVLKYSLIHDLVEVYAGDTRLFDKNQEVHATKQQREHDSLLKLESELSEFPDLISLIKQYEARGDEESRFVYALDKVLPPINIYLEGGRTFKTFEVTYENFLAKKLDKVKEHPEVEKYFLQLKDILEKEKEQLFFKEDEKI